MKKRVKKGQFKIIKIILTNTYCCKLITLTVEAVPTINKKKKIILGLPNSLVLNLKLL